MLLLLQHQIFKICKPFSLKTLIANLLPTVTCAWYASTPSLSNRTTSPDTRHTQASVQFTTLRHPSQFLMSHTTFCADTTIQQYSLQNNFNICTCTILLKNDLAVINAHSYHVTPPLWPLALICLKFPACCFLVSQSTAVFAFDLVTMGTVLCLVSALSTEV